jgi:hypothetical protein
MQRPCLTRNEIDDSQDAMDRLPGGDGWDLARIWLVPHLVGYPVNHQQSLSAQMLILSVTVMTKLTPSL